MFDFKKILAKHFQTPFELSVCLTSLHKLFFHFDETFLGKSYQ